MARTIRNPALRREARWDDTPRRDPVIANWDDLADAALSVPARAPRILAALDVDHTGVRLLDPCTHHSRDGERIPCSQADDPPPADELPPVTVPVADILYRAHLTAYANGF